MSVVPPPVPTQFLGPPPPSSVVVVGGGCDPHLIDRIVCELKSQGIFDSFRKECLADVDTKPAYQNLRQRVEGSVSSFLKKKRWTPELNKNQVREALRKNIQESGFLETGVERIVDQVLNPKIKSMFLPKITEVVYEYMGYKKPTDSAPKTPQDLLPKDLEAISPEVSDDEDNNTKMTTEDNDNDDESPPFEPLDADISNTNENAMMGMPDEVKEESQDFSGLINREDSTNMSDSKDDKLVIDEMVKMEIDEDSSKSTECKENSNLNESNDKNEEKDKKSYHRSSSKDSRRDKEQRSSSSKKQDKRDKDRGKDRDSERRRHSSGSSKHSSSYKTSSSSSSSKHRTSSSRDKDRREKDKERRKSSKDDHYSSKHKSERRSTDRDSNDGNGIVKSISGSSLNSSHTSTSHKNKESANTSSNSSNMSESNSDKLKTIVASASSWEAMEKLLQPNNESAKEIVQPIVEELISSLPVSEDCRYFELNQIDLTATFQLEIEKLESSVRKSIRKMETTKFLLPLSPSDSEKSFGSRKIAEDTTPGEPCVKRSRVSHTRYSSDDLYKPRPVISRTSRRRKPTDD